MAVDDPATATKTLEARLVEPTAWKADRLDDLTGTYREALHEAFDADCTSMSQANDVVTPYDLPYQAKDALKNYVPQLLDEDTYGAEELAADHPVRFVNRAASFDRDSSRYHEVCWEVPMPGRGTNVWIPIQRNPDQEPLWEGLLDEDSGVTAGEIRLQRDGDAWLLHVTVEFPVEDTGEVPDDPTPVGFDVGESMLAVGCALQRDAPTDPLFVDGAEARRLRKEMFTTLRRLQERNATE